MTDLSSVLDAARRPERTAEMCLRGDLQAELEELERRLADERRRDDRSMGELGTEADLTERIDALREQMRASTVTFRLRALPARRTASTNADEVTWAELVAAHPPRDEPGDLALGYNADTFFDALVRVSVVDPCPTGEQWDQLLGDGLTSRQFDELAELALTLNRRKVDVPFSSAASGRTANSDES